MQILLCLKSLAPFPGDPFYFWIPWSQLLQFLVGGLTGRTFFQKVGKVLVDVHSIRPCHFYHCVDQSTCLRSGWNDREQPVFPVMCCRTNRKNWVIIDSVNGAEASAGIYSLVETAKANGLRPYFYIRYVLSVMKEHADEVFGQNDAYIENLRPWSGQLPEECHQQPDPSTTTAVEGRNNPARTRCGLFTAYSLAIMQAHLKQ